VACLHDPHDEEPQLEQLGAPQEPQEDPCELVKPLSLLWLKVERSFLTLAPLQVGQDTS
jgi:hypothetical protein